ncbi:MAG: hypothetical protein WAW06_02840 [bacterium]
MRRSDFRSSSGATPPQSQQETYLHTQIGWPIVIPVEIGSLVCLYVALTLHSAAGWITFALLSLATTFLFGLTVVGTPEILAIRFGVGLVKKTFKMAEIASAQRITTSIWNGWGIRLMLDGTWLFNVSGFGAVKLRMLNGRSYAIGTDEPDKLLAFIERARRART